jgi:hypothetical protein
MAPPGPGDLSLLSDLATSPVSGSPGTGQIGLPSVRGDGSEDEGTSASEMRMAIALFKRTGKEIREELNVGEVSHLGRIFDLSLL